MRIAEELARRALPEAERTGTAKGFAAKENTCRHCGCTPCRVAAPRPNLWRTHECGATRPGPHCTRPAIPDLPTATTLARSMTQFNASPRAQVSVLCER